MRPASAPSAAAARGASAAGRARIAAVLGATLLALALRSAGVGDQTLLPDDASVARTAENYAAAGWPEPTMWNHPRLRDVLVHASMSALGRGPWGIRLWSVALGALSAGAAALLAFAATESALAAAIAGVLVAVDPLHVDFSRQGINDVHVGFFAIAAVLALLRYRARREVVWLASAGVLAGLGAASKWSALFPVAAVAAAVLAGALREADGWRDRLAEVAAFVACVGLLPVAVYVLTWWPWLSRGHDLGELVRFHAVMAHETATHVGYPGTKLPGYPGEVVQAWRWFVAPVWYVEWVPPGFRPEVPIDGLFVAGVSNLPAWLATLPACGFAAWRALRRRDAGAGLLVVAFLAAYVPFVAVPRPVWTNSAVTVVPFALALVAAAAAAAVRSGPRARAAAGIWLAASVGLALVLWKPATGGASRLGDAAVRTLVSPAALDRWNHFPRPRREPRARPRRSRTRAASG